MLTIFLNDQPHLRTRDALKGDVVFGDAPFLLAPLRENDESEKPVVKACCGLKHNMIVVSKDIFSKKEYSIEQTPLEEPCVEEFVEVTPSYRDLIDTTLIKFST